MATAPALPSTTQKFPVDYLVVRGGVELPNNAVLAGADLAGTTFTASSLNYYEEYTHGTTATILAFGSNRDIVVKLTRIGKVVTCSLGAFAAVAGTASKPSFVTAIPARFRPTVTTTVSFPGANNSVGATILMEITTAGAVAFGVASAAAGTNVPANFTVTNDAGWPNAVTVSWYIA
jgi:hypothetical protein